ncbi:DNA-binding transcriptional ArsR family regulator [Lipingzhangella halophila]|uniref:DNA-binding transcriptional ArsR family regulator n=1 Tax=Lipingzhangella halophila TaxID=1783352 RepID=A0A7W7W4E1_9ACTN|nr:helix-turn-helix domain-containing protein [Lipingzhangella halophila]MBB4933493.1 DNA-binding transcriptional ArsR family regulator [Lipingzhangella halophila]
MDTVELLSHPVRLRIVHALSGGARLTTAQLVDRLPDVSKATVYRHVGLLAEGGLLEVDGEQRVRGAVERRYRVRRDRTVIDGETAAALPLEDHRRGFASFVAALLAEFNVYLDRDDAAPASDGVSYWQGTIWLSQDELAAMVDEIRDAIWSRKANEATPDRAPHLLSTILFPTQRPPEDAPEQ